MKKIAAVSYLNTVPFIHGIKQAGDKLPCELILTPPSQCPAFVDDGSAEIALVTVAEIAKLKRKVSVVGDYCLGTQGTVRTVVLLANRPIKELKRIYTDPDSCTSNNLAKILCKEYWGIEPEFVMRKGHTEIDCGDDCGYVLIGDRVFDYENRFNYCTDLSTEWMKMTGLPFVFAAWVAVEGVENEVLEALNSALKYGVEHIEDAVDAHDYPDRKQAIDYLTKNLDFKLDSAKRHAMELFTEKMSKL